MKAAGTFVNTVVCLLIVLWVYAAASKLLDYAHFRAQLGRSPLISGNQGTAAVLVPLTELVIAGLLAPPRTRFAGLYAAYGLLCLFTAYLLAILNYSYYIPCSCGGILNGLSWRAHIYFNASFIVLAATAIQLYPTSGRKEVRLQNLS